MRKNTKNDSCDSPRSLKSRARIIAVTSTFVDVYDSKSHTFVFFIVRFFALAERRAKRTMFFLQILAFS